MEQYLNSIHLVKELGVHKGDRTGTGTQSMFGQQERYSLRNNVLPVVTTKKIHLPSVIHELFWMLSGNTRVDYLIENGVRIWNEWVKPNTAVYRELNQEELDSAILKKVGGPFALYFHSLDDEVIIQTRDVFEASLSNDEIVSFWNQYPTINIEATHVVGVNTSQWMAASTKDFDESVTPELIKYEYGKRLYKLLFGVKPLKLIGGDLGAVYGKVWRDIEDTRVIPKHEWVDYEARGFDFVVDIPGTSIENDRCVVTRRIDQIQDVIDQLKTNPDSRRIIVCAWAPQLVDEQSLPPCHSFFQFWTRELPTIDRLIWLEENDPTTYEQLQNFRTVSDEFIEQWLDDNSVPKRALSCQLYQRSADAFLGVPFNITFYSLLTHMLANQMNMVAEEFIWSGGDVHIYSNHQEQTDLQLTRWPKVLPTIRFKEEAIGKDIREIGVDDFVIENYEYHPHIAGKVAV
ncbi:thymidylate synthase [Pseudomonas aeruginosa]|uniref:thymidylate synthase n=1 Tax=Pseudomonas aeruginosa TaxID=287 RepID=UPI001CA54FE1|nr:thymidylate synthase [Pseudomonas aeruginosa]MBW6070352.1 thymidylate synthase [Pseudomonas aeruginosa]